MNSSRGWSAIIKKKSGLSREEALEAVPVRNEYVREERGADGGRILVLPRKDTRGIRVLSKLFFLPGEKKMALDEIGSWVWERCGGETTVSEMIDLLGGEFKVSRKEAEVSLMSFLKKLSEKKLIGFMLPKG